jgi:hypothetical protein
MKETLGKGRKDDHDWFAVELTAKRGTARRAQALRQARLGLPAMPHIHDAEGPSLASLAASLTAYAAASVCKDAHKQLCRLSRDAFHWMIHRSSFENCVGIVTRPSDRSA